MNSSYNRWDCLACKRGQWFPSPLVLTHRLVCMLGKTLKGDSRMTGCLSDMASYWSTEIIPIMNSVQCGGFRTLSPESWLSDTSGETLRFGSHDLIRHTCVNCDGGQVSECGFELLVFPIFLMCGFEFPFIFRSWRRTISGHEILALCLERRAREPQDEFPRRSENGEVPSSRKRGLI